MFSNPHLGDIFLINSHTNTIHAASALSEACGINGEQNGRFGILPCESPRERELMLQHFAVEFPELSLCPHCFAKEEQGEERAGAAPRNTETATCGQEQGAC